MVKVREDLTGKVFGRLTVIEQAEDYVFPSGKRQARWLCRCSCGDPDTVIVSGHSLKLGTTLSCGCLQKENAIKVGHKNKRHNEWLDDVFINEHGEYRVGFTSNTNKEFYIDAEDYELLHNHCWLEHITPEGYGRLETKDTKVRKMIAMTKMLGCQGYDHADRNPLNNRKYNLRPCTIIENCQNRTKQSNNTSGVIGVCWMSRDNVWVARIGVNKHRIHIGSFSNKEDAIVARLQAEAKYFGKFAPQRHLFETYGITYNTEANYEERT